MRSVPNPQNEPGPQPYPLPLHCCSKEALGRWSEEFVYGLGLLAPGPGTETKDPQQTDTLTHPRALGTDGCAARPPPPAAARRPGRPPGPRALCRRFV